MTVTLNIILWSFLWKLNEMYADTQTGVGAMNKSIKKLFNLFCFTFRMCNIFFKDLKQLCVIKTWKRGNNSHKKDSGQIFLFRVMSNIILKKQSVAPPYS
jgi:hypothetical protein